MGMRVEIWEEGPTSNTFPGNLEGEWNLKKQIRGVGWGREGTCGKEYTKAWFEKNHGYVWKIMG